MDTGGDIRLGSMLFTLVEPHRGHEVEYNRWYERDHFYAGCMIGAWQFAGRRWVATKPLKDLRTPRDATPITPDPNTGSYLAIYWVLDGHHDEWNKWAVDQVNWLHANGRMFNARDHIHTLLYKYEWQALSNENGTTVELALDRAYEGLVATFVTLTDGSTREQLENWYRNDYLPEVM